MTLNIIEGDEMKVKIDGSTLITDMMIQDFTYQMKHIEEKYWDQGDIEQAHLEMDRIMADWLKRMGFHEGIEIFEKQPKWYA